MTMQEIKRVIKKKFGYLTFNMCREQIKMKWLSIPVSAIISSLLLGCIFCSPIEIVSITPNKTVYHSGDYIELNVTLKATKALQNVTITAIGLKNSVGQVLLNKSMVVNLVKGINNVTFKYRMPYCSPCKNLNPGIYPIEIIVSYKGKVVAKGIENIELKR